MRPRLSALARHRGLRALYCLLCLAAFAAVFLFPPAAEREARYRLFGVAAYSFPGGDSRNIQMAAHCQRLGQPYVGRSACVTGAEPVVARHPDAWVPPLNYPSLWVRLYGALDDGSESYFMAFWRLNALVGLAAVALLCWRLNPWLLPLAIFSPPFLLCVERGNVDAILLALVFVPLVLSRSGRLHGFCIGLAAALKLFPVLGLAAALPQRCAQLRAARWRGARWRRDAWIGALLAAPLIALAVAELPDTLRFTSVGFEYAYGLTSLQFAPQVTPGGALAKATMAAYCAAVAAALFLALRSRRRRQDAAAALAALRPAERTLLLVSLCIFVGTFVLYVNWSYRLIFLLPALLVLAGRPGAISRVIFWSILAIMWAPIVPQGGTVLNLGCLVLAPMALFLIVVAVAGRVRPAAGARRRQAEATAVGD